MKLLDANILLYAYNSDSPHHEVCRIWLEQVFNGTEPVALPWQTALAFVRIATNSRVSSRPLTSEQACSIVDRWLDRPNVTLVGPTEQYWSILRELLIEAQVSGPLVTDAALAALALELRGNPMFDGSGLSTVPWAQADRSHRKTHIVKPAFTAASAPATAAMASGIN